MASMRPRTEIPAAQIGAIHRAMLAAPGKAAFQRLQCLWLRASQDLSTEAIAQAVGLSVSHVRRVWSEYLRGGAGGRSGSSQRRTPPSKLDRGTRTGGALSLATPSPTRKTGHGLRHPSRLPGVLGARFDGVSPAGAAPVAAGRSASQASQRQPGGPCRFSKNFRPQWTWWRLDTRTGRCG